MTARLPIPGGDDGEWGALLNQFLDVAHNPSGTIKTGAIALTQSDVGLGNVDNTSDVNKPVSTATQTALNSKSNTNHSHALGTLSDVSTAGVANGQILKYNGTNWVPASDDTSGGGGSGTNLSSSTTANTVIVASDSGADATITTATSGAAGILTAADKTKLDGIETGAEVNDVTTVAGRTGAVTLTKTDVGLANVDNTNDDAKPVSTATQTALNLKSNLASPTFTGNLTVPTISIIGGSPGSGKVLTSNTTGDATWVAPTSGLTDHTLLTNIGTNTHAQIDSHLASTANPHSVSKAQVGLGNVDDTSDLAKPISTAQQTALNAKAALTPRVVAITDGATVTIDVTTTDIATVTLAGNRTLAFSGTPLDGQKVSLRVRQDSTGSRTLSMPTSVRWSTDVPLTAIATGANLTSRIAFEWNAADSKWDVLAINRGF